MEILNGKIYRHFKGGYVLVISTAKHSDREEVEVVYKGLNNGKIYARPIDSFKQIVTNDLGYEVPRFELATEKEVSSMMTKEELGQIEVLTDFIAK